MSEDRNIVSTSPLVRAETLLRQANDTHLAQDDYPAALANFAEAVHVLERAHVAEPDEGRRVALLARAHMGLFVVYARHPDPAYQNIARAEDQLDRALMLAQDSSDRETILTGRFYHALFLGEHKQDWLAAAAAWEALLVDRPELGNGLGLGHLAVVLSHIGPVEYGRILSLFKQAIAIATENDAYHVLAMLYQGRARLLKDKIAGYSADDAAQDMTTATIFRQMSAERGVSIEPVTEEDM